MQQFDKVQWFPGLGIFVQTYQLIVEILSEFDFIEMSNTRWPHTWLKIFGMTTYYLSQTIVCLWNASTYEKLRTYFFPHRFQKWQLKYQIQVTLTTGSW